LTGLILCFFYCFEFNVYRLKSVVYILKSVIHTFTLFYMLKDSTFVVEIRKK